MSQGRSTLVSCVYQKKERTEFLSCFCMCYDKIFKAEKNPNHVGCPVLCNTRPQPAAIRWTVTMMMGQTFLGSNKQYNWPQTAVWEIWTEHLEKAFWRFWRLACITAWLTWSDVEDNPTPRTCLAIQIRLISMGFKCLIILVNLGWSCSKWRHGNPIGRWVNEIGAYKQINVLR